MIQLAAHNTCTGCGACESVCKTNSISFVRKDDNLFSYPVINSDTCVECRMCEKVCPILNDSKFSNFTPRYYCAWSNDEKIRSISTSGGVGTTLSKLAIDQGYYVCGAKFDDKWHLSHTITNIDAFAFAGSKYLQSDIREAIRDMVKLLLQDKKVFFIGTPCQVEAVKNVIPDKKQDNLITCSIICHGVNSPVVWSDFVSYLEKKYHSKLVHYNFRSKDKGWGKLRIEFDFENGKHVSQEARKNLFHVWFGRHYIMRESCFNCKYRKIERYSDLVIGDFWGIEKVLPNLDPMKGCSVVIVETANGYNFISKSKDLCKIDVDAEKTVHALKGFLPPTDERSIDKLEKERKKMMDFGLLYNRTLFTKMARKYHCPTFFDRVIAYIQFHFFK